MADEDDKKTAADGSAEVDGANQDESAGTPAADNKETSTEVSEGEAQSAAETAVDWWKPDQKRFTQFKGETLKEYFENLETAYGNSYEEVKRIKAEKLAEVANATGSETDDKADAKQPPTLTDAWVTQEMQRRHVEQYNSFADKHPEVNTDQELFDKLDKETGRYMDYIHKSEGRIVELAEALDFAWQRVAPKESKDEKVASALKDAGSGSKSKSVSKDPAQSQFSDKQIEAAKRIDPSLRNKSRTEVEAILAKYK